MLLSADPRSRTGFSTTAVTPPRAGRLAGVGVTRVVIHADSGSLKVDGTPARTQIVAAGTACTSDEDFLRASRWR